MSESFKKFADIVYQNEIYYIATIWTGPNYYIDRFEKALIDQLILDFPEEHLTPEKIISQRHVGEMLFMCRNRDFSELLLSKYIGFLKI